MKTKISILFLIFIGGIYSCKKDKVDILYPPKDYRDSVTGSYFGTMHYVHAIAFGTLITVDTTYSDTIGVAKDQTNPKIISAGYCGTLRQDFSFADDDGFYSPHGYFSGSFSLPDDSIHSHFSYSWQGAVDTYDFKGRK
jgi:hypothetical protein